MSFPEQVKVGLLLRGRELTEDRFNTLAKSIDFLLNGLEFLATHHSKPWWVADKGACMSPQFDPSSPFWH